MSNTTNQRASSEIATNWETKDRSFGPVHIVEPKSEHTHTAIMLHGRGSTGTGFAEEFLESALSDGSSLFEKLPGCRWVFPSSQELWSVTFQENIPAWFEACSLTDITARQDPQISGIKDSVDRVINQVNDEIRRLDGNSQRLLLGGISQGGAIALWALLSQGEPELWPGAVAVASTWLPFAAYLEKALTGQLVRDETEETESYEFVKQMIAFISKTSPHVRLSGQDIDRLPPVFIGHGVDDAYVDVELGRHAACILAQGGFSIERKEYSGAEQEGHWFKIPDEMDDIHRFLGGIGWI